MSWILAFGRGYEVTAMDADFTYLFTLVCANFGLAYIVGHSAITEPARDATMKWAVRKTHRGLGGIAAFRWFVRMLVNLAECPMCFGTWAGFIFALVRMQTDFEVALQYALAACGANLILSLITGLIPRPADRHQISNAAAFSLGRELGQAEVDRNETVVELNPPRKG